MPGNVRLCISNKLPGNANAAGPRTILFEARLGIHTRDPESKDDSVFILPGQHIGHGGPHLYWKNGFLERT